MGEAHEIPTGRLARTAITGATAAKVGAKHLAFLGKKALKGKKRAEQDKEQHEEELGKLIFQTLSQLRGTALKVSQMLSMEVDLFPENIRKELAKACHQVLPLNRALIRKVFMQEYSKPPEKLFQHFTPQAFAAASLGQVHEAVSHEGENVAVKIQYPGIASSIDSDMKLIRSMLKAVVVGGSLLPKREVLYQVLGEIEERLKEEVDYECEAQNTQWFAEHVTLANIKIPEVVESLSSRRVLVLKRMEGLHLKDWLATNPSQEQRNHFGQLLFDFFVHTLSELQVMHADPHPGNFLFRDDGQLGVLDFGCVKRLSPDYPPKILKLLTVQVSGTDDKDAVLEIYKSLEMLPEDYSVERFQSIKENLKPFQEWLSEPFQSDYFDFGKKGPYPLDFHSSTGKVIKELTGVHQDQVYFDRSYIGLINMLKEIGAVVNTSTILQKADRTVQ